MVAEKIQVTALAPYRSQFPDAFKYLLARSSPVDKLINNNILRGLAVTHRILGRRAVVGFGLILLFTSCGQPRATTTKIPDPAALPLADLPLVNAELFETPVRLKFSKVYVNTGTAHGHSGPTMADLDQDGDNDLIVGDFSGKFRYFKNIGSATDPEFGNEDLLLAGDEPAQVPIY